VNGGTGMSRAKKVLANIGKYSVFCLLMGLGGVIVTTIVSANNRCGHFSLTPK
jgi:hypothetical protein